MGKSKNIETRTNYFIAALKLWEVDGFRPSNAELANVMGITNVKSISEIKARRQNISQKAWEKFKAFYNPEISVFQEMNFSETSEKFMSVTKSEMATMKAAIKILISRSVKLESMLTKEDQEDISLRLEKTMKEATGNILAEWRT